MACWYVLATGTFGEGTMDGTTVTCFVAVGALNHCSPGYHAISAITCTLHERASIGGVGGAESGPFWPHTYSRCTDTPGAAAASVCTASK